MLTFSIVTGLFYAARDNKNIILKYFGSIYVDFYNRNCFMSHEEIKEKLRKKGTLHGFHYTVIILSLSLTFFAWYFSQKSVNEKSKTLFDREANQVVERIRERVQKYEDALAGGVAYIKGTSGETSYKPWKAFADSLKIHKKYPGINGIGVIYQINKADKENFIAKERQSRADFNIHPRHETADMWPITLIEPLKGNEKAVGLDMAFEKNRYSSILKAKNTGKTTITGPITLVQDARKTPGFLFYAPYYKDVDPNKEQSRSERFQGVVYAPFIVEKLMEGTLASTKRNINVKIIDDSTVLYEESGNRDESPLFEEVISLELYGRVWQFQLQANKSFRKHAQSIQPMTILAGGIFIDILLLILFTTISTGSKKTLEYADEMNRDLQSSNAELKQFAFVASHDLQEPLRKVIGFSERLEKKYADSLDDKGKSYIEFIVDGATRMKTLIQSLLELSRVENTELKFTLVNLNKIVKISLSNLEHYIAEKNGKITTDVLPKIMGDETQLIQVFQNLISNAIKYNEDPVPTVHLSFKETESFIEVTVKDNGIGISEEFFEKVFVAFQRLHARDEYEGTGIGLFLCKKIAERHKGELLLTSKLGVGSEFTVKLKKS
jgi:signal transduction histidine kinase